jgi:hypothetical protein
MQGESIGGDWWSLHAPTELALVFARGLGVAVPALIFRDSGQIAPAIIFAGVIALDGSARAQFRQNAREMRATDSGLEIQDAWSGRWRSVPWRDVKGVRYWRRFKITSHVIVLARARTGWELLTSWQQGNARGPEALVEACRRNTRTDVPLPDFVSVRFTARTLVVRLGVDIALGASVIWALFGFGPLLLLSMAYPVLSVVLEALRFAMATAAPEVASQGPQQ